MLTKFCFILSFFRIIGFFIFPILDVYVFFFYISAIGSIVVGCLGALVSSNIKQFFAFISLNHLGYFVVGLLSNENFDLIYFSFLFILFYFFNSLVFLMSYAFLNSNTVFFNFSFKNKKNNFFLSIFFLISTLFISGLPPFSTFFIKVSLINELWLSGDYLLIFIIVFSSFFSIFYYFKLLKFFNRGF